MKHKYSLVFVLVIVILFSFTSCSDFLADMASDMLQNAITELEQSLQSTEQTDESETLPDNSENETENSESDLPEIEQEPDPRFIYVQQTEFNSDLERRASEKIDGSIRYGYDILKDFHYDEDIVVMDYDSSNYPMLYDTLDDTCKEIYDMTLKAALAFEKFEYYEKFDFYNPSSDFLNAWNALYKDYPEINLYCSFYTENMTNILRYYLPNDFYNETDDMDELIDQVMLYRAVFDRIIEKMPANMTNLEKIQYFTGVIMYSAEYDYDLTTRLDPFQAYNALISGVTICQGYTQALRLLCHAAGVDCKSISGWIENDPETEFPDHIWNCVETDKGTRYVDVTWTDSDRENYGTYFSTSYFMMDEEKLEWNGYKPDYSQKY